MTFSSFKCLFTGTLLFLYTLSSAQTNPPVNVDLTSSNIPIVVINTSQTIPDEPGVFGTMGVISNPAGVRNNITDPFNAYNSNVDIELRGNSSLSYPKKSYGFETLDLTNVEKKYALLGMPAESDWTLLANYLDNTFIKNALMFNLWSKTGRYSVRTRYCEVVINNVYQGLYLMTEKIKRDSERVNIKKMSASDTVNAALTGGYIVKKDNRSGSGNDRYWDSPYFFSVSKKFVVDYPKDVDIKDVQFNYIKNQFIGFENALNGANYRNPTDGYRKYIDADSFIDYFLMQQFAFNIDGFHGSQYFHKNRNEKIVIGPLWDFDESMPYNTGCTSAFNGEGWIHLAGSCVSQNAIFWWEKLLTDCYFSNKLQNRYQQLRGNILSETSIFNTIDSLQNTADEASVRNSTAWNIFQTNASLTAALKSWITKRLTWMDAHIGELDKAKSTITANTQRISHNTAVALSSQSCAVGGVVQWIWKTADFEGTYENGTSTWSPLLKSATDFQNRCYYADNGCTSPLSAVVTVAVTGTPCPPATTVTTLTTQSTLLTDKVQAGQQINASNTLLNGYTIYQAGQSIVLTPGFKAESGAVFQASIKGCNGE